MWNICKRIVESDFHGILYRKIENIKQYEELRRELENLVSENGKIDYQKLLTLKVILLNRIEDLEYEKERTLSVYLPVLSIIISVTLGVVTGYLLLDSTWEVINALGCIGVLGFFTSYTIMRSDKILKVKRNELVFHNTIKNILDRMG